MTTANAHQHHLGEDLAAMADGGAGLEPTRKAELAAHVTECSACRVAIAQTQAIFRVFSTEAAMEPSSEFDQALFARLGAADRAVRWERIGAFVTSVRGIFTMPRLAVVGVAAGAAALALVAIRPESSNPQMPDEALAVFAGEADTLEVAENLAVLEELDLYDNLDVLDDLEVIEHLDEVEAG